MPNLIGSEKERGFRVRRLVAVKCRRVGEDLEKNEENAGTHFIDTKDSRTGKSEYVHTYSLDCINN